MKITLISGLSGAGKSTALNTLEDMGYYCVDNLPAVMLREAADWHRSSFGDRQGFAASVDARSALGGDSAAEAISALRLGGCAVRALFLESAKDILLRRFSETRRAHPLTLALGMTLGEALDAERGMLEPLRCLSERLDTSKMKSQDLRSAVARWIEGDPSAPPRPGLSVSVTSFGFKYGLPLELDFMFDVRCLPNPYYDASLRDLTGLDRPVREYFEGYPEVAAAARDVSDFLLRRLPAFDTPQRSYVSIGIGCTGGRHRSVYVASLVAEALKDSYAPILRHRDMGD